MVAQREENVSLSNDVSLAFATHYRDYAYDDCLWLLNIGANHYITYDLAKI